MILGMYMLLEERNHLVDFPNPFLKSVGSVMMPVNKQENEKVSYRPSAVLKPFQWQVLCWWVTSLKLKICWALDNYITSLNTEKKNRFGCGWAYQLWLFLLFFMVLVVVWVAFDVSEILMVTKTTNNNNYKHRHTESTNALRALSFTSYRWT